MLRVRIFKCVVWIYLIYKLSQFAISCFAREKVQSNELLTVFLSKKFVRYFITFLIERVKRCSVTAKKTKFRVERNKYYFKKEI